MRLRSMLMVFFLALAVSLSGLFAPAEAFWPFDRWFSGDKPELTGAPPPAEAIRTECDPILQKIQEMNRTHRAVHPFVRPRIGLLKREYYGCLDRINAQEYEYLKRAEIEIPKETTPAGFKQKPAPDLPPLHDTPEN